MVQYKYEQLCAENIYRRNITLLRRVKIILAFLSSASLASWAIWNSFPKVWSGIIVISGLLLAINEYLPYQKRITDLSGMIDKLCAVFQNMEENWFDVIEGRLTEEEIFKCRQKYVKEWERIANNGLTEDFTDIPKTIREKCKAETRLYFDNFTGARDE